MGRLPAVFAGRPIRYREPYSMSAELNLTASQSGISFAEASFLHNVDKPFEIHKARIELTPFDADGNLILQGPQFLDLTRRVRLGIMDVGKNQQLTKVKQMVSTLVNRDSGAWEWADPYYLVKTEGFDVTADSLAFGYTILADDDFTTLATLTTLRVELAFQGFLVVVAPPGDER